jgi:hypothetical protein
MGTNNFIHPHPFFPLHPHQLSTVGFEITTPSVPTTTKFPKTKATRKIIQTTTTEETSTPSSTTELPETTTTPEQLQSTKLSVVVGSVKTHTIEEEKPSEALILPPDVFEKMDTSTPKEETINLTTKQLNRVVIFPSPSSTLLPTAQQVNETTTSALTTITSTLPPPPPSTTNLPKKISAEVEKAEINGVLEFA